jgi:diguanylate cyclase (GGDEF)-like protein
MLDVDNFKSYNDRFGHVAGDEALQAVVGAIAGAIRGADKAYRYGGEEFCILLPDAGYDGALSVAERVREAVEAVELRPEPQSESVKLTVSIGVAVYPDDAPDIDGLISCADVALYRAKHGGRNRVVVGCEG